MTTLLKPTPWDTRPLNMPTWEVTVYSAEALLQAAETVGHHTLKVDPLADKRLLHEYGFYYCDTLIEPYCTAAQLRTWTHPDAAISKDFDRAALQRICVGAFAHGRFHRDFNLPHAAAEARYVQWLNQLIDNEQVYGLYWQGALAGFIGYSGNNLLLHAIAESHRGKGLAKYGWSLVCTELLQIHPDIQSSISASNLAVLNLYVSLGCRFRHPQDIYHRITK